MDAPASTSNSYQSATSHKASENLGLWEPKRTLTLEAARRHSRNIKLLRILLLFLALGLFAVLIWQFAAQKTHFIVKDIPGESVKMIKPKFTGRTKDGLPYKLTSTTATRLTNNEDVVDLDKPILNFMRARNVKDSIITATQGTYDDVRKILDLEERVDLQTDDGYHCESSHARIFTKDKRIEGRDPISCDGGFGQVTGETYAITDDYELFIFDKGMTGRLEPENEASSEGGVEKSATSTQNASAGFGFDGDEPILIKADKATYKGGLTILTGSVDVRQGESKILSDVMYLYRAEAPADSTDSIQLGAVTKIDARGNFIYTSPGNDVRGERGVYKRDTELITVTGNVKAKQPQGNIANTERLTYNVRTKTIRFDGNCVGQGCQNRSTIRFGGKNN